MWRTTCSNAVPEVRWRFARAGATTTASGALPARTVVANFVVFQAIWFACVLGAAHGDPWFGTICTVLAVAWHLSRARDAQAEARLVAAALVVGLVLETVMLAAGVVHYPNGQFDPRLPPHWLLALWALFAITLNVSLRWLKRRWIAAALLGMVGAPLSFAGGVRLGAATFSDQHRAMLLLAIGWGVAMPLLMWLSDRCDGMLPARPAVAPILVTGALTDV